MKKILIVDDQLEVRELVDVTLRVGDYEILKAESGEKGIEIVKAEKPELIIMDVMMPGGMDGLAAVRKIKSDPETKGCKVIMLTAKGQEADRKAGFEAHPTSNATTHESTILVLPYPTGDLPIRHIVQHV